MCTGPLVAGSGYAIKFLSHFCLFMFSLAHHLHCSRFQHSIQSIKIFRQIFSCNKQILAEFCNFSSFKDLFNLDNPVHGSRRFVACDYWTQTWAKLGGGHGGRVPPTFPDVREIICHVPPYFYLQVLYLERFQNKSDVCHVLCEELFMLDVTHNRRVDVETGFGVVSLILMFW